MLSSRSQGLNRERTILWSEGPDLKPRLQARVPFEHHRLDTLWNRNKLNPLVKRGWTFQEAELARRIINFTSQEVQWSCRIGQSCECDAPLDYEAESRRPFHRFLDRSISMDDYWTEAMQNHLSRSLTYCKDALPALSGLSKRIHAVTGASYAAGLWREHLPIGLLWSREEHTQEPYLPEYNAPTFSWASLAGHATPVRELSMKSSVEMLDLVIHPKIPSNPFGEVVDGFLRLRGPFLLAHINWHHNKMLTYFNIAGFEALSTRKFRPDTGLTLDWAATESGEITRSTCRASLQGNKRVGNAPVACLLVGMSPGRNDQVQEVSTPKEEHPFAGYSFLVLGRSKRVPGAYERLGLLEAYGKELKPLSSSCSDLPMREITII